MKKIELLAPAKDLSKAKIAVDYGANAVYVGGKSFSLRSRASNFDNDDIIEIVKYAHSRNVKVYVTVNILFHDEDFDGLKEYLINLEQIGVDAIIVSSVWLLEYAKKVAPKLECHVSTQLSTTNSEAVETLRYYGADRVILARECSIDDIKNIVERSNTPIEVFIHGGMCANYSGRCTLSNRMTNRDANRGGCAHSCRWKYHVYEGNSKISDFKTLLSLSSKDLRASEYIEDLIKAGVASLKIEGRMKSDYYIAQVVKTYRNMIDEIEEEGTLTKERLDYYNSELDKAENRPSDSGFLSGKCDNSKQLYGVNGAGVTHDYVGIIVNYDKTRSIATVEVKNAFKEGDNLEVFGPITNNKQFKVETMFNDEWKKLVEVTNPTELIYMRLPFEVNKNDMIRKVQYDN